MAIQKWKIRFVWFFVDSAESLESLCDSVFFALFVDCFGEVSPRNDDSSDFALDSIESLESPCVSPKILVFTVCLWSFWQILSARLDLESANTRNLPNLCNDFLKANLIWRHLV